MMTTYTLGTAIKLIKKRLGSLISALIFSSVCFGSSGVDVAGIALFSQNEYSPPYHGNFRIELPQKIFEYVNIDEIKWGDGTYKNYELLGFLLNTEKVQVTNTNYLVEIYVETKQANQYKKIAEYKKLLGILQPGEVISIKFPLNIEEIYRATSDGMEGKKKLKFVASVNNQTKSERFYDLFYCM